MAILEFEFKGIDQNFRSSAANVLKDIDKIKSAFSGIGGGSVDVSGLKKGMDEVRASIKLAESDNKMFLATKLADTRQAGIEELNATRSVETQKQQAYRTTGEAWKAQREQEKNIGVGLDNSFKETRNSIAKLNEEQKRYNATQRETRDTLKSVSSERPYTQLTAEMNRVRKEAQDLGAQMIRLEIAGDTTSKKYIQLATAFKTAQQSLNPLDAGVKKLDGTLGQHQRNVGNYQQTQSGANGVTMEFNRIIQDAPFGMMGIGNNIQQLAANWQHYAQQQRTAADGTKIAVSNMSLMKGAISSLFSPANLLTLGIAAITSAWTFYSMNTKTAKEETKDMNNQFTTQLGKLTNVISLTQKSALTERDKAIAVGLYNKELGDTLGKVKTYSELEKTLIKNGSNYVKYLSLKSQAEATYQISLKQTAQMMTNIMSLESKGRSTGFSGWVSKASDTIDELVYGEGSQGKTKITSAESMRIAQLPTDKDFYIAIRGMGDALKKGLKDVRKDWKKSIQSSSLGGDLTQEFNKIADGLNLKMPDLNLDKISNSLKGVTDKLKESYDYLSQIRDLVSGKQKDIDLINVDGQAKDLIELEYKWQEYFTKIADLNNKLQKDIKNKSISSTEAEKVKEGLRIASGMGDDLVLSEQSEILKKYQDIRLEIIRKSNEEAGIFEQQSRETDLAKQKIWLDEKLKELVKNGAQIKQAMEDMLPADLMRTYNINIKWDNKDLEEWGKLNDKIQETIDKPFSGQNPKSIQAELEKRIGILKELLEQLARATGQPFNQDEFDKMSKEMKDNASNQKNDKKLEKDIQDYTNILKTGVDNVFTNLKTNIDEFGWKAESVFYSLGETVGDILSQMSNKGVSNFMDSLTTINENGKTQWQNMDSSQKKNSAIGAGLGVLGRAFTDLTPKTSSGGQAIGGALTGAAAGMQMGSVVPGIGTAVGAAAGAVVGGISGLLKAAKNKRQEKIIQDQLEEQKKANRLLERMSALTYASQIVGQKTEYGIVSGVRRNEFGQIVSVVQGQDIIMVADRANNKKQR